MTLDDLIVLWQSRPQLSLRRFAQYASVPYWRLRDHQHSALVRCAKQQHRDALYEKVRQAALQQPTSGYRLLYQELKAQGEEIGLHKIRVALGELHLHPPLPRKIRKPSTKVSAPQDWPEGRRVQIDATRLSLPDGVCWIYFVLDVTSRVVLASRVVRSLSMHLAKLTLDEAIAVLRTQGHHEAILVQSDGGSDFTSDLFHQGCLKYGPLGALQGVTAGRNRDPGAPQPDLQVSVRLPPGLAVHGRCPRRHAGLSPLVQPRAPSFGALVRHALVYTHLIGERSQRRLKSNLEHYRHDAKLLGAGRQPRIAALEIPLGMRWARKPILSCWAR